MFFLAGIVLCLLNLWRDLPAFLGASPNDELNSYRNIAFPFFCMILGSICYVLMLIDTYRNIIIVGCTGSGKTALINRFLRKRRKDAEIVLLDGCEVYNNFRNGNKEIAFPKKSITCEFLIIDSISMVKETPYWDRLIKLIHKRQERKNRTVFVVQSMLELENQGLDPFLSQAALGAYTITLPGNMSLSKTLRKLKCEYSRKSLCINLTILGGQVGVMALILIYVFPQMGINFCRYLLAFN